MKNPWSSRNLFVKNYIPENISIVDFGCGNKEILDFCNPSEYLGIDITDAADLKIDLNSKFDLNKIFDIGLLLGVLEYVEDPNFTLTNVKKFAKKFIILSLPVKQKVSWKRAFTDESLNTLLTSHFTNVSHHRHGRYILSTGESL